MKTAFVTATLLNCTLYAPDPPPDHIAVRCRHVRFRNCVGGNVGCINARTRPTRGDLRVETRAIKWPRSSAGVVDRFWAQGRGLRRRGPATVPARTRIEIRRPPVNLQAIASRAAPGLVAAADLARKDRQWS